MIASLEKERCNTNNFYQKFPEASCGGFIAMDDFMGHVFMSSLYNTSYYYSLKIPSPYSKDYLGNPETTLTIMDLNNPREKFSLVVLKKMISRKIKNSITILFSQDGTDNGRTFKLKYTLAEEDIFPLGVTITSPGRPETLLFSMLDNWYHLYKRLHELFPEYWQMPVFSQGEDRMNQALDFKKRLARLV